MKRIILLIMVVYLCGCAQVSPFIDARREAGQVATVGQSRADKIAVCYHRWWHAQEDVQALAETECAKQGKRAEWVKTTFFNCRLVTPTTDFFVCR